MPTQSCNITQPVLNKYSYNKVPYACTSLKTLQLLLMFSSVQLLSRVRIFATPWTAALQASLSITNSQSLLKLMCIESVISSNYLILCCALLLLPSIFPSIRVFSNDSLLCIRWPNYWSFSISPSNEYIGLISYRIAWFDLAVQGTLKSLLQHHNSKASILQCSAFFMVQHSHPYMATGKTRTLTRRTFVGFCCIAHYLLLKDLHILLESLEITLKNAC